MFMTPETLDLTMLFLIPLISAFIGWITNVLAVKMLFHPRIPFRVLGITIQGIFPKRRLLIAERLANVVTEQLFSSDDLRLMIQEVATSDATLVLVKGKMLEMIKRRLPEHIPMFNMFVGDETLTLIVEAVMPDIKAMLAEFARGENFSVINDLRLNKMISERVATFSDDKLEALLMGIMRKEFGFIEHSGAVLGFIIGLVQAGLVYFSR